MNNANPKIVGLRARNIRNALGWDQTRMAGQLGVSPGMISHYETGRYLMPIDVGLRLSKIGKVSLEWLYGSTSKRKEK